MGTLPRARARTQRTQSTFAPAPNSTALPTTAPSERFDATAAFAAPHATPAPSYLPYDPTPPRDRYILPNLVGCMMDPDCFVSKLTEGISQQFET